MLFWIQSNFLIFCSHHKFILSANCLSFSSIRLRHIFQIFIITNRNVLNLNPSPSPKQSFNVTTGGLVTACPIAPEFTPLADITKDDFDPKSVHGSVVVDGTCADCDVLQECGGRCLYANKTDWWGRDGFAEVCNTIRHLLNEIRAILPRVQKAIESGKVTKEMFHYPRYNNTTEIIP